MKAFLFILLSTSAFAVTNLNTNWVHIGRGPMDRIDVTPQETTRPIVQGDIVYYANTAGNVFAIHRLEGYVLWERKLPAPVQGAFALGRSRLYVGDLQGSLWALNARDGSLAWEEPFKIQSEWLTPPAIYRDQVLALSGSEDLYAISESKGKEIWHYSHRGDEKMTIRGGAAPVVFGTDVYQGFSDGYLIALSVKDGKVVWQKKLKSKERFYDVDATPYVDEHMVLASSYDGKLYSLNRLDGEIKWVFPVGIYSGFLVEEKNVYFSGLNSVFYALDKNTGTVVWKTPFSKGVGQTPTRVGDYLVIPTSGDPVYLLDPTEGRVISQLSLGAGAMSAAVNGGDNWVYCLSNYGNLYSFQLQQAGEADVQAIVSAPTIYRHREKTRQNSEPS